ncbi:hypothetical protein [Actinoplanes sp. NPDC051851]|uniref:hypothetical protein n=1 Tax=Actinoplanes sp. NPDC051851 TaxID=3154753 RepID=UPI003419850B
MTPGQRAVVAGVTTVFLMIVGGGIFWYLRGQHRPTGADILIWGWASLGLAVLFLGVVFLTRGRK